MKKMKVLNTLIFSFLIIIAFGQGITNVSFTAKQDSYTASQDGASTNYNSTNVLVINSTTYNIKPITYKRFRAFVNFDITSIPSNAIITSAKLRLRPNATEPYATTNSTELYADLCNASWDETTITDNSGISNNTAISTVTISNLVTISSPFGNYDVREFDVKAHVQALVENRIVNYGWRIRRNPETGAYTAGTYYTHEAVGGSLYAPTLIVSYYIPMSVSAATFTQASTTSSSDGAIYPTIINGSSTTKTYQWYSSTGAAISGATSLNLTGVPYGWYGLRVWGSAPSEQMFYGFLLAAKCATVNVTFAPDGNYIDDAMYYAFDAAGINNQINYGSTSLLTAAEGSSTKQESLLKFRLWIDPNLTVNTANLTLYGNGHAPTDRANTSYFKLVNAPWAEMSVAGTNAPTALSSPSVTINAIAAGNGNATINIASLVNIWKMNNTQNYGGLFQLISYAGTKTLMQFNSSDATAGVRPSLVLNITSTECSTNQNLYVVLKDEVGPEIHNLPSNKLLKFRYTDYFDRDVVLNYSITGITDDATIINPIISVNYYTNWLSLNLSSAGLVTGNVYLLQVTDADGNKKYLKFKVN